MKTILNWFGDDWMTDIQKRYDLYNAYFYRASQVGVGK